MLFRSVRAQDAKIGDKRVERATPEGSVATASVGGGQKAVLMRIPSEWYKEDQRLNKQRLIA